jgi:hypothetical protein
MSLRQLEEHGARVRCLTHHFLTPLASPSSTPSTETGSSSSTYLSASSSLSSPNEPLDERPVKHTFAHTLGFNAIAKGPTGYDLVSFGEGGTNAIWLARTDMSDLDSDEDDILDSSEYDKLEFNFWVATFPTADHPSCRGRDYVRKLRLPRMISPGITAALDLDDTQGIMCIATTHGEVIRLRFD